MIGMIRGFGVGVVLTVVLGAFAPRAIGAQVVIGGEEVTCECVDPEGNRIENCTCIRSGEFPIRSFTLAGMERGRRAQVGVYVDSTGDDAEIGGVRITEVVEDSPAERAGLRAGDIVLSIDGRSVLAPLDREVEADFDEEASLATQRFVAIVGDLEPEEPVEVVFLREGERRTLEVTPRRSRGIFAFRTPDGAFDLDLRELETSLDSMREALRGFTFRFREGDEGRRLHLELEAARDLASRSAEELRASAREARAGARTIWMPARDPCTRLHGEGARIFMPGSTNCVDGVRLAPMNEGLAGYFGTDEGVLVTEVAEATTLGLLPGDVILAIGEREVTDVGDVRRILSSYEIEEAVTFRVRREDREIQVSGTRRTP
ncbi:MAG: PDZ domain-containing protein [Longimicrobiales bacterium]|nr:PDZ domain-containing protein [Longimicrobiales bacterium]